MFTEAYAAQMSLPTEDDLSYVARRFKEIGQGLWAVGITPFVQSDIEWEIIALNKKRYDPTRVRHLLRALRGSDADDDLRRYEFQRLVNANQRDEVAALVAASENPQRQLEDLCGDGKYDLAGYAAAKLTAAKWADLTAGIMAELDMVAEAERRALQYVPAVNAWSQNGLAMLTRLAVTESRRGRGDSVQRLAQMVLDAPGANSIAYITGNSAWGQCEGALWNEWPEWRARSIHWLSIPKPAFDGFPSSGGTLAANLGAALAGTGINPASLKLIDGLIALVDREVAANPPSAAPPKGADEKTILAWADRQDRHRRLVETRKSLMVARVAAGGEVDDAVANALDIKAANRFVFEFPHSQFSLRVLSLSAAERRRLEQASPGLETALRYAALIQQGQGREAQALALAHPRVREQVHGYMLKDIIASLQNAVMEKKAEAMLDAFLDAQYGADTAIVYLLLRQKRTEKAKAILHDFVSSEYESDVFAGVMLLHELGEPLDAAALAKALRGDPEQKVDNWLAAIDALAWSAASDEIDALLRNPPNEIWALSAADAARMRCTAYGLQAIALARGGQLEAGLRLVTERDLAQREYGCKGDRRPFFDLRYLVQEWVERGHAQ